MNISVILVGFDVISRLIILLKETINFSHMRTKLTSPRPSITETKPQFRDTRIYGVGRKGFVTGGLNDGVRSGPVQAGCEHLL